MIIHLGRPLLSASVDLPNERSLFRSKTRPVLTFVSFGLSSRRDYRVSPPNAAHRISYFALRQNRKKISLFPVVEVLSTLYCFQDSSLWLSHQKFNAPVHGPASMLVSMEAQTFFGIRMPGIHAYFHGGPDTDGCYPLRLPVKLGLSSPTVSLCETKRRGDHLKRNSLKELGEL